MARAGMRALDRSAESVKSQGIMLALPLHASVSNLSVRNYWWASVLGGLYFVGGFVAWGGSRASIVSSGLFLVTGIAGVAFHFGTAWSSRTRRVSIVVAHLLMGQLILIWQNTHLPLSDYTASNNPDVRAILVYLVSSLLVGGMSMFGGVWGALIGLVTHYAFIVNWQEEFSFKWAFPLLIALAGNIVSSASWRLDDAYQQMERLANNDYLTGLFNRRRLTTEYARLQHVARETGRALLLVVWDLDDLKHVNDTQGHVAGDEYIKSFAQALRVNMRTPSDARFGDACFRVGGDEFISLHLDAPDGDIVRQRTSERFRAVSAGWVRCDTLSLDQALTQADEAMYRDKALRKQLRATVGEGLGTLAG
jgi:diguanylate cyclase (GGDEF)-like protein